MSDGRTRWRQRLMPVSFGLFGLLRCGSRSPKGWCSPARLGEGVGRADRITAAFAMALAFALPAPATAADPPDDPGAACEQAGAMAELAAGLPDGVLRAIGIVESGRRERPAGRVAPWPWTIDLAGRAFFLKPPHRRSPRPMRPAREGALTADIGCFQISMLYHPSYFRAWKRPSIRPKTPAWRLGLLVGAAGPDGVLAGRHCRIPLG